MASGPIISWQIHGETCGRLHMQTVTDFILGAPQITADGACSHEIKRSLLLGRRAIANLDSVLKSRDIIYQTENSERDGNTRPPDLHLEKSVCRSGSNN